MTYKVIVPSYEDNDDDIVLKEGISNMFDAVQYKENCGYPDAIIEENNYKDDPFWFEYTDEDWVY